MNNINELKARLGVHINDYVIYFNNGKIEPEFKKGIWKVIRDNGDFVDLKCIANSNKFTTKKTNCVNVEFLKYHGFFSKEFITPSSLVEYNEIINNNEIPLSGSEKCVLGETVPPYVLPDIKNYSIQAAAAEQIDKAVLNQPKTKQEKQMSKMNMIVNNNVEAAKTGALITAGRTLNSVVKDKLVAQVPRKYRNLVKHPLADVVIANAASFAVQTFAKTNYKAKVATDAMMQAAMIEFFGSFNIEKIISDVLKDINLEEFMPDAE